MAERPSRPATPALRAETGPGPRLSRLRVEVNAGGTPSADGFEVVFGSEGEARAVLARLKSQMLSAGNEVYELGRSSQDARVLKLLERLQKGPGKP